MEEERRDRPAILPASVDDAEGPRPEIDERQDVLDVVVDDVLRRRSRAGGGGCALPAAIRSRMSPMPDSIDSERFLPDHLMPLYSLGLCEAVIRRRRRARLSRPRDVGAHHAVVHDVGPRRVAPSMNAAAMDGDDSRMSRETAIRFAPRKATKPRPIRRAPPLTSGIESGTS